MAPFPSAQEEPIRISDETYPAKIEGKGYRTMKIA